MDVDRDAATVVAHRNRTVGMDDHGYGGRVTGQSLVNAVVDNFVHHVVQTRAIVGVADIHARAFADGIQPLENLDGIGAVALGILGHVGHVVFTLCN